LAATRAARQSFDNIMDIGKEGFVLPAFAKTIHDSKQEIMHACGLVLLHGLPIEGLSFAGIAAMYWGFVAHIGSACSQNALGYLLDMLSIPAAVSTI
jgi:hypothetical protein